MGAAGAARGRCIGDVAGALMFLLSDASKFITGQNLVVDDGFSL